MNTSKLRVKPGAKVKLNDWNPADTQGHTKEEAEETAMQLQQRLSELQEVLFAQKEHALLIVLQAMDAAGKDGTIRHVCGGFNPQGCSVTSFKAPTEEELDHDFLWRVHKVAPLKGHIGVFNRSHYEDVLIVRVHKLVPKPVWSGRYERINAFERLLATDGNVTILKFFLHVSKEEQGKRLEQRMHDPSKQWKVNMGDFEERKRWKDYMAAYEDALTECNTGIAPWHVIPADRKWFRNLAISRIIVDTMEAMKLKYPKPSFDTSQPTGK